MTDICISQSEISVWTRCPRKWYLSYYLGAVPAQEELTGSRILGTRVHTALEAWQGYDLDPLAVLGITYQLVLDAHPEASQDLLRERELATTMVEGYVGWLAAEGHDAGCETVATEADVQVPLPGMPGVLLRARLDAIVRDADGTCKFKDYKTGDLERHELLALDFQFKFYCLVQALARQPGDPPVTGGMVDTLRRVKRTAKSTPPYYARDRFSYNPDTMVATGRRVTQVCEEILAARDALDIVGRDLADVNYIQQTVLRPNPMPRDCSWSCPFVTLCPAMDDGSDWPGMLTRSGRWRQTDPYSYYRADPLAAIRAELARL
jgi:RecB family exonuclease